MAELQLAQLWTNRAASDQRDIKEQKKRTFLWRQEMREIQDTYPPVQRIRPDSGHLFTLSALALSLEVFSVRRAVQQPFNLQSRCDYV